jgi:membrane associated rhomboid family serine protease
VTQPSPSDAGNYCYRHPDRQSFVLCQRCGRTICGQCQTPAAVGVHCPECVREARANAPRVQPAVVTRMRSASAGGAPVVTYSLIGTSVLVYLLQVVLGSSFTSLLSFSAPFEIVEPWRLVTSLFAHSGVFHLLFNMYALYIFGGQLERTLGRGRFAALYAISGVGGAAAVALIAPVSSVIGASGAIFGLMAAFFVIARSLGGSNGVQLLVLVGINLVIGIVLPNVSWQAHLGGLVAGGAVAFVFSKTRHRSKRGVQTAAIAGIGLLVLAIVLWRSYQLASAYGII